MDFSRIQNQIEEAIYGLVNISSTSVCIDIEEKLNQILKCNDENQIASSQLKLMVENINYARMNKIPVCQDTGHINFFITIGDKFPFITDYSSIILKILNKLSLESKIRPNTVDPLTNQNPNNNGGINTPSIYYELQSNSDNLIISVLNKGGGSENMSSLFMLPAASGQEKLVSEIISKVKFSGGKPCPPTVLGICIGGDASKCMYLAKKALLRPLNSRNRRKDVANLELELLEKLNQLDVGIMGLGGTPTCLDVHIEVAMRHPATYPVGLIMECYCHRVKSCKISSEGILTYGRLNSKYEFEEGSF